MPVDPRSMWRQAEAIHALTYFAPESHEAFEAAGLRGFWRGYFAGRGAPLGPADAVGTRLAGIDAATRRVLGHEISKDAALDAAHRVRRGTDAAPVGDRPLF